ncbi:helix-turn-helix transcriptional regulator [Streptomyces sp. Ru73]|uniref:helix-turn-helix domain-containing protein n=1 Tax=Streptomyces sp. Ru73 TaxID=2080748 RepID=UPI0021566954|nr:helix-turn-helix transcriptional regulator [Streptomyces sp. Ru73]
MPDQLDGPVRDFVSGLRHMHGELGLSLKDLEARLPASRSSLSRYLRGQSLPDERLLVQWCKLSFTGEDRLPELVRLLHLANEAAAGGSSDETAGGSERTEVLGGAAGRPPKSSRTKWALTAAGTVLVLGAATAVVVGLTGDGPPNSPAGTGVSRETGPAAKNGKTERITVHNVEKACQHSHRRECALGLALDPYVPYRPSNIGGRVWHGDRLTAQCRIANGVTVTDEAGGHNSIWYKVRLHDKDLWFPGIRIEPDQLQYSTLRNCPD